MCVYVLVLKITKMSQLKSGVFGAYGKNIYEIFSRKIFVTLFTKNAISIKATNGNKRHNVLRH